MVLKSNKKIQENTLVSPFPTALGLCSEMSREPHELWVITLHSLIGYYQHLIRLHYEFCAFLELIFE